MIPFWDEKVADWVGARLEGGERGFGECKAMGVAHGFETVAGVVFHNWCPESGVIEISCAAENPRWMTRTVMNEAMSYAFSFCQMVVARIHQDNTTARKLWRGLGASEFIIPRMRGRRAAEAIYTLTDGQWEISKFKR